MRNSIFRPKGLSILIAVFGLAFVSAASAISPWDWSQHPWPTGSLAQTYHLVEDGIDVTISVSTTTLENPIPPTLPTFASWDGLSPLATCTPVLSPNLDGAGSPSNRFGTNLDLGIVYDPAASRDQSVLIDIKFTQLNSGPNGPAVAIPNFKFEISDVDWSAGGVECIRHTSQGFRRDQVVITAMNHGVEVTDFSLSPSPANTSPTFLIEPYNVATAIVGSESNTDEKGTVVVNFSSTPVTDVTIIYNEAGYDLNTNNDPGYRGIGILGGMTSLPVELMDFSIE